MKIRYLQLLMIAAIGSVLGIVLYRYPFWGNLPKTSRKESVKLTNVCSITPPLDDLKSRLENPVINGNVFYKYKYFDFSFSLPNDKWEFRDNFVQEFEENIAYPPLAYALNLTLGGKQINSAEWAKNGTTIVRLSVFNNYCQSLNAWFEVLPDTDNLVRENLSQGSISGYLVTSKTDKELAYIIFNKGFLHYQFKIMVKNPKDYGYALEIQRSIISSFSDFE